MKSLDKRQLQREDEARISDLEDRWANGCNVPTEEVFKHSKLAKIDAKPKTLLASWDTRQTLLSVIFNQFVVVTICPYCKVDLRSLRPLLDTGEVVPLLLGSYTRYPKPLIDQIAPYAHISPEEYGFLRTTRVIKRADLMCGHCLREKIDNQVRRCSTKWKSGELDYFADYFCEYLTPAFGKDFELVDRFCEAIRDGRKGEAKRLCDMSGYIARLRECQAVNAMPTIRLNEFQNLTTISEAFGNEATINMEGMIADGLAIDLPSGMPLETYLSIVLPFKNKLIGIAKSILVDSHDASQRPSIARLTTIISDINEQIRTAQKTRRYQAAQAVVGMVAGHPSLTASILIGGSLGLCASMMGCATPVVAAAGGVSAAASAGARWVSKAKKFSFDDRVKGYAKSVIHDVKSQLSPLLANYLQMDVRAVQVWQIRDALRSAHKQ